MFGKILLISDISFLKPKYKKAPTDNILILWNQKEVHKVCSSFSALLWNDVAMVCIRHTVGDTDRSRCLRLRDCLSHLHPLIRGRFRGAADSVGSGNLPPPLTFSGSSRTHDQWFSIGDVIIQSLSRTDKRRLNLFNTTVEQTEHHSPFILSLTSALSKLIPGHLKSPTFGTNITSIHLRVCWFISCGCKHTGTYYQSLISIPIFQICLSRQRQTQKLCRS